jgi:hypothetical protein
MYPGASFRHEERQGRRMKFAKSNDDERGEEDTVSNRKNVAAGDNRKKTDTT